MIRMNGVEYLAGGERVLNQPLPIYSDEALSFLAAFSEALMCHPDAREFPDVMAAAFWCRKANLRKLRESYKGESARIGRGVVFHIAPSNIPVNFAFSYFFALLAGNANIVRIPSNRSRQAEIICEVMGQVLLDYPEIGARTMLVRYPRESTATQTFSSMADARMIWGGDGTIKTLRACEIKPRCLDVVFADRYSIAVIDGGAVLQADEKEIHRLAESFYNDTFLMDQNACSSPQLILWQNDTPAARERFWAAALHTVKERYLLQGMTAMDKYVQFCYEAMTYPEIKECLRQEGNLLYRSELSCIPEDCEIRFRGKGGYFYEYSLDSMDDFLKLASERYQTVTYFGIDAEALRAFVMEHGLLGVDRIVPIGQAMDIGVIWDGYDLISMLSRIIAVVK